MALVDEYKPQFVDRLIAQLRDDSKSLVYEGEYEKTQQ